MVQPLLYAEPWVTFGLHTLRFYHDLQDIAPGEKALGKSEILAWSFCIEVQYFDLDLLDLTLRVVICWCAPVLECWTYVVAHRIGSEGSQLRTH
jgi:hypothetical protein